MLIRYHFAVGVVLSAATIWASAQTTNFPNKTIRVVIPVPPGGSIDTVMRLIAPRMSETIGQSVVLETRPGASTNLGMELVARAPGDGYTLVVIANNLRLYALMPTKLGFDPKEFVPITIMAKLPYILDVHPKVPVSTASLKKAYWGVAKDGPAADVTSQVTCPNGFPCDAFANPANFGDSKPDLNKRLTVIWTCEPQRFVLSEVVISSLKVRMDCIGSSPVVPRSGPVRLAQHGGERPPRAGVGLECADGTA